MVPNAVNLLRICSVSSTRWRAMRKSWNTLKMFVNQRTASLVWKQFV